MIKISKYVDVETTVNVEITLSDIIENLYKFSDSDISDIHDAIIDMTNSGNTEINTSNYIVTDTVDDDLKLKTLKELFNKYSWYELEELRKKHNF